MGQNLPLILKSDSVQVTGDDVGTYKVTLSNDLGEASTEGKLTLSGAPQFKEKIEDQSTDAMICR